MRVSIVRFSSPRQYAPAIEFSLNALIRPVDGACGPRQRSVKGPLRYSDTVSTPWSRTRSSNQLDLVGLVLGSRSARSRPGPRVRCARTARRPRCARASRPRCARGRPRSGARPPETRSRSRSRFRSAGPIETLVPGQRSTTAVGHHVGGVVADQPERVVGVVALALRRDDRDRRAVGERRRRGREARRRP